MFTLARNVAEVRMDVATKFGTEGGWASASMTKLNSLSRSPRASVTGSCHTVSSPATGAGTDAALPLSQSRASTVCSRKWLAVRFRTPSAKVTRADRHWLVTNPPSDTTAKDCPRFRTSTNSSFTTLDRNCTSPDLMAPLDSTKGRGRTHWSSSFGHVLASAAKKESEFVPPLALTNSDQNREHP